MAGCFSGFHGPGCAGHCYKYFNNPFGTRLVHSSTIYLTVSLVLAWSQFQKNRIVKIVGIIAMVLVFGIGYLSGSVGALGVGFVVGEYESEYEKWLGEGLIYKENVLGNAVSNHRGKKVEIYKTIPWFPVLEWKIKEKEYNDFVVIMNSPLKTDYDPEVKRIHLSSSFWWERENKQIKWADTLIIR